MKIQLYQIDAFADRVFAGNPAAVCPLDDWIDDGLMQRIALENNLSETAFFVPAKDSSSGVDFDLRWFTPAAEVDLCGHATLASAFVVQRFLAPDTRHVRFGSRSGPLDVRFTGDRIELDFPSRPGAPAEAPPGLVDAVCAGGATQPLEVLAAPYWMMVFESEGDVRALRPDFAAIADAGACVIATAPGTDVDFVSRFFAPAYGIDEDPVTGSAHCTLTPYWADKLSKTKLRARQISARGGELECEIAGERTRIAGTGVLYMRGEISV